jgi:hypothetical protein
MAVRNSIFAVSVAVLSCMAFTSSASALTMTFEDGVIKGTYDPSKNKRNSVQRKAKKQCPSKKFSFYGEKNQSDGTVKFEMRCQ